MSTIGDNISQNVKDIITDAITQKELYVYSMDATGTNTLTATFTNLTLFKNLKVSLKLVGANTGAMTLNINSIGAKSIKKVDSDGVKQDVEDGDFYEGNLLLLEYDDVDFVLMGITRADLTELKTDIQAKTLTAGNGLTGGGTLAADRTFAMGTPSNVTPTSTNGTTSTSHTHAFEQTATGRLVTDAEKAAWNAKLDASDFVDYEKALPTGAIIMWSGAFSAIPEEWALCNGENDTPDLTDRFILATNTEDDIGDTGGANTVTLTTGQIPEHTHTASTNETGAHTHDVDALSDGTRALGTSSGGSSSATPQTVATTSAGAHSHTVTVNNAGGGEAHENRPAFYKLAFIIKL